jgi:hypothetical protein
VSKPAIIATAVMRLTAVMPTPILLRSVTDLPAGPRARGRRRPGATVFLGKAELKHYAKVNLFMVKMEGFGSP